LENDFGSEETDFLFDGIDVNEFRVRCLLIGRIKFKLYSSNEMSLVIIS